MIYDEEYVERQLEEDNIWYSKHDAELNSLRKSINLFLSTNNTKSIYSLCECFDSSDLSETFKAVPDIAYCIIAITISEGGAMGEPNCFKHSAYCQQNQQVQISFA